MGLHSWKDNEVVRLPVDVIRLGRDGTVQAKLSQLFATLPLSVLWGNHLRRPHPRSRAAPRPGSHRQLDVNPVTQSLPGSPPKGSSCLLAISSEACRLATYALTWHFLESLMR